MHAHDARAALGGEQVRGDRTGGALGRGLAAGQLADAALARQAGQHRYTQFGEAVQAGEQFKVVHGGLAEAEAGICDQVLLRDAGQFGGEDALGQEAVHLRHHVVVARVVLHRARLGGHVHQHHRHAQGGGGFQRALAAQGAHIVDHAGAGLHRRAHHLRLAGVDADRQPGLTGQAFDHRDHAAQLLLQRHFLRAGAGGLAADIKEVGALGGQLQRMRHRRIGAGVVAAVGERVGSDVDDTHHPGAVQLEGAAGAVEGGNDVEHRRAARKKSAASLACPGCGRQSRSTCGGANAMH